MRRSVARGTMLGIAGQAWHLVAAFLLYAFLARQLGPDQFGQWRLVLSVLGWFEIVLHDGYVKVATKVLAEAPDRTRVLGKATYAGQAVGAAAVLVAMLVLAGPVAGSLSDPTLAMLIRVSALDVPFYALFLAATAVLLGTHRFERQIVSSIVYATVKVVAVIVLVAAGFSVEGALIGNAIASVIGFAVAFVPLSRLTGCATAAVLPQAKTMAIAAVPFLTLGLVEGLGQSADLWVVSAVVASATAVGWYASATVLAEIPTFLFGGLTRVLFPSVTRAFAEGDERLASRYTVQAVRLGLMVTVLGVALIASTGAQVLELLYSDAYVAAYLPLAILMVASVGRVVRVTCTEVLMARDRRSTAITILVTTIGFQVVLLAAMASRFGIVGAAVAASAAALIGGLWSALSIREMLGVRPVLTLVRCAVAGAVVGGALAWLSPEPVWILAAYPAAAVVYALLLRLLGEVDSDDIASVRSAVGR